MNASADRLPSYALVADQEAQRFAEVTQGGRYGLTEAEKSWKNRYSPLESRGYILRPRYRPGWSPSWLGTNLHPKFCEDSIMLNYYHVIDAIRKRDKTIVSLKIVPNDTDEVHMARFLTTPTLLQCPTNHCVPLLDILPDPLDGKMSLLVMPYLRPFDDPEFGAIGEVVDFMRQTLEGMCFLHGQQVAHRDCAAANIMMDARPLYPKGHHPIRRNYSQDGVFDVTPLSRLDHPVRYYFIDFEISIRFPPGCSTYVVGKKGRDKDVPELSFDIPYDAFKVDIFALGNLYDKEFLHKYCGLEVFQPLIDTMKDAQPSQRPTADQALVLFEELCAHLNSPSLRWRLRSRTESAPERVVYDTVAAAREGIYHLRRLIS
ncbi:hypothetical protein A0H81_04132 [Grifola frondosa]|uniref:Protein kinase domain-containing protein n=1 Tax=Grifola frondosa TaxID=5627 RepID=A0A1C7MGI6_GRIFR|nr:hypothetical protein A0H81_04132 [Grifola frondosa]